MISLLRKVVSSSVISLSDAHLRRFHNNMAKASLKELHSNCRLTKDEKDSIKALWGQINYRSNGEWHQLYKAVNGFDRRYVPNDVYGLEVIPRLNSNHLLSAWDDKAYYKRFFPNITQPTAMAYRIDGQFYNAKYKAVSVDYVVKCILEMKEDVIVKPSDGLEGRGVELWKTSNFQESQLSEKLRTFGRNYVVQTVIKQHRSLALYNESSVNPIRVMTLRLNGKIHYLHSTLRFGSPGKHTDMCFLNGKEIAHVCAVDNKGTVSDVWYDMDGKRERMSYLGISCQEMIPNFDSVIETALSVHEGLQHFDLIGCDITVDKGGTPILIEYNVFWPGIIIPQYCHGPLFGDLTEEVIYNLTKMPKK